MSKRLKAAAGVEGGLFVGVLVVELFAIATALRNVSRTLRLVSVGVRAIEKQAVPLDDQIEEINRNLDRAAGLLHDVAERRRAA
jgi:hypothetical protein